MGGVVRAKGINVINSAVFHAGFLVGRYWIIGCHRETNAEDESAFTWPTCSTNFAVSENCRQRAACAVRVTGLPGVSAVALNTSVPAKIAENVAAVEATLPSRFGRRRRARGLISILPASVTDASD